MELFDGYFGKYPCSELEVCPHLFILEFLQSHLQVNYEMDGKSYVVDKPMTELTKEAVQKEPAVKFKASSESTLYEIVMVNFENKE